MVNSLTLACLHVSMLTFSSFSSKLLAAVQSSQHSFGLLELQVGDGSQLRKVNSYIRKINK